MVKAGLKACFQAHTEEKSFRISSVVCAIRPFFLSSCFSSCHRGNKKQLNLLLLPSPGAPQALGLLYWLREVRRAEDGVEIEVKWDVWYNGG